MAAAVNAIIAIGGSILTLVATFKIAGRQSSGRNLMLVAQSAMFGDAAVPLFTRRCVGVGRLPRTSD
jgi:hypothetical protein